MVPLLWSELIDLMKHIAQFGLSLRFSMNILVCLIEQELVAVLDPAIAQEKGTWWHTGIARIV